MGVSSEQIVAWAQPKVHEEIVELIDQIQGGEENAAQTGRLSAQKRHGLLRAHHDAIRRAQAVATIGTDPYQLVVWGPWRRSRKSEATH